jgi:hypothetical protein
MSDHVRRIPEQPVPGKRLGRHVEHDERSRAFSAEKVAVPRSIRHRHHGPVLDQGNLGSCTGNALVQCLMVSPDRKSARDYTEENAVAVYELATTLDDVPGQYPPDDTGSSGLAACKAAQQKGMLDRYTHCFGVEDVKAALSLRPVMVGVNWYEGFDKPDEYGRVSISGAVRGGLEFVLVGQSLDRNEVVALNSWGRGFGRNGFFRFSFDDLSWLLGEDGDATVPEVDATKVAL